VWWILTFVTSIPALLLYDPLLNDANYIVAAGAETRIQLGALLEIGLIISGIVSGLTGRGRGGHHRRAGHVPGRSAVRRFLRTERS
jgi:hypothetical protein